MSEQQELRELFDEADRRGDRAAASSIMDRMEQMGAGEQAASDPQVDPNTGTAPAMAQVGRGMMDVYQGGSQLAVNAAAKVNEYTDTVDDVVDTRFTPGSVLNKASKALLGGIAYLVPDVDAKGYNESIAQELKLYNRNNPDFQINRVLGSIATPLSLVPGAAATKLSTKVATGMGAGSLFSMFQPVENTDEFFAEKANQALWGAGFGAAIPAGGKVLSSVVGWLDDVSKPLYASGVERDVADFLKKSITQNKGKIVGALNNATKSGDKRTVGQIIAETVQETGDDFGGMLVRLEKDLSRESDSLKSLYARQSGGRRQVIDGLTGSPDDLAAAIGRREQNGVANYVESFKQELIPDAKLTHMLDNKYARSALKEAKDVAHAAGTESNTEILHYVKLGLDKQLAKAGDLALSRAEKGVVSKVKSNIVGWLEESNPAYATARRQYQLDSIPINRMKVGQELKNALVNSLETDTPSTFTSAVRDSHKIIKKATGFDRYKGLQDIYSPDEVAKVKGVARELILDRKTNKMAAASKSVLGKMSSEVRLELPHILSRPIVITNHILSKLGQDKSSEYKAVLEKLVQDPDAFVRAFGGSAKKSKTKIAMDVVRRLNTIIAAQTPARELGRDER